MCRTLWILVFVFTIRSAEGTILGAFQKVKKAVVAEDPSIRELEFQSQFPPNHSSFSLAIRSDIAARLGEESLESTLTLGGRWNGLKENPSFTYQFRTLQRGAVILTSFSTQALGAEFKALQTLATKVLREKPDSQNRRSAESVEKLDNGVASLSTKMILEKDHLEINGKSQMQGVFYGPLLQAVTQMVRQDLEEENPEKVQALKIAVQEYLGFIKQASGLNQSSPWSWKASEERLKKAKFGLPFEGMASTKPRE